MPDADDSLEEFRRRHGIRDDEPKRAFIVEVGCHANNVEEYIKRAQASYQKEQAQLVRGGADYGGKEQLREMMRRLGRG